MKTISNKITVLIIAVFCTCGLFSCGNVLNNEYSKQSVEGDLERIQAIGRLDSTDYETLTDYMLRNGLISPDLKHINQSYGDLLKLAREEKIKLEKAQDNARKIKENKQQFVNDHEDHMHKALIMLPEKSEIKKDYSEKNAFKYRMVFVNPTEKTVRAFKGKFTFYDLFDTELKTINLTFNDTIPAKDTLKYTAFIDFSHLNGNTIYVTQDFKDLKVVWQPMKILYNDGSTIENVDNDAQ